MGRKSSKNAADTDPALRQAVDLEVTQYGAWMHQEGHKRGTCVTYMNALRRAYLHPGDLLAVLRDPTLPKGSRSQLRAALGHYVEFLEVQGDPRAEPLAKALKKLPKIKGVKPSPKRPLSNEEWRRLAAAAKEEPEPLATVLELLCTTGLRVTVDLGRLERDRVKEACEYGTLYLRTKGGDYRSFPAKQYQAPFQRLLKYEWEQLWQAVTPKSKRAYYMTMYRGLRRCAERAGLDPHRLHPHLLRATTATQLLRATKDLVGVQKRLGHAQITTTQIYVGYMDVEEMEADDAALERFRREEGK